MKPAEEMAREYMRAWATQIAYRMNEEWAHDDDAIKSLAALIEKVRDEELERCVIVLNRNSYLNAPALRAALNRKADGTVDGA